MPCDTTVKREGDENVIEMNCIGCPYGCSIADSAACMANIISKLMQVRDISRVVLKERRIYEYSVDQTRILIQIADLIKFIRNSSDIFSASAVSIPNCPYRDGPERFNFIQSLVTNILPRDPIAGYLDVLRRIRAEKAILERDPAFHKPCRNKFLKVLDKIKTLIEKTTLVRVLKPQIGRVSGRNIYSIVFRPMTRPNFTFTRLMAEYPKNAELIYDYKVGDARVNIFRVPESVRLLYHIMPPEFKLTEEQLIVLDEARKIMAQHRPKGNELLEPERVRAIFYDIASDLITDRAASMNIRLKSKDNNLLSNILVRETAGFGVLELVLQDDKVQDLTINAPPGRSPIFVYHADAEDCESNVIPTSEEVESWAARLRLMSGRPLDQANPVLDTSLTLPGSRARVAAITKNLSPYGLAFSFRRHRDKPWTYPLLIKHKMISSLGAGLMSFLVEGARTMLIAGTRGAGKTSFLGATLLEIMRRYRIISVEDTLELPVKELARLGYNVLPMKVQSAIIATQAELGAAAGIRTSLRLGDSCLIVGEVRSEEAIALYEAMRVGALANVVAGTIHGESPYGVFDRVVHDLGVPPTSFKATDIIVVANPIRSADGLHKRRRIIQITEVRKRWKEDPMNEHGFLDLMVYNPKTDLLEPSRELIEGESEVLSAIAGRVREWIGNFDAVWDNIKLRAKTKQALVDLAAKSGKNEVLESDFVVRANDMFHIISGKVKEELGGLDSGEIFSRWNVWLRNTARRL